MKATLRKQLTMLRCSVAVYLLHSFTGDWHRQRRLDQNGG